MTTAPIATVHPRFPAGRSWQPVGDPVAWPVPDPVPFVQGVLALSCLPPANPANGPPEPRVWAQRFVSALVEVIDGDRPPAQLARWTSRAVFQSVTRYSQAAGRTRVRRRSRTGREQVASVRVSQPAEGAMEVSARIRCGDRFRALAARLDAVDGGWRCTALQLG
jgi:hypothetical protein